MQLLIPCPSQNRFKFCSLSLPAGLFSLQLFVELRAGAFNLFNPGLMNVLGFFKCFFSLRDCQFALLALFFLLDRFLLTLSLAPLFFFLERKCCSDGGFIIEFASL